MGAGRREVGVLWAFDSREFVLAQARESCPKGEVEDRSLSA